VGVAAIVLLILEASCPWAQAPDETSLKASGSGVFQKEASLLVDGVIPQDATDWNDVACVSWEGKGASFLFDMGSERLVRGILLCVDNNDTYRLDYSLDGKEWKELLTLPGSFGKVDTGMETFSSKLGTKGYDRDLVFKPVAARHLRLVAVEGDDLFAAAELQVFSSSVGTEAGQRPSPPLTQKPAPAQPGNMEALPVAGVKGTGAFHNDPSLLVDGKAPADETEWQDPKCVWWEDPEVTFVLDLGREKLLKDFKVQVDNNDDYQVDYSLDGRKWASLVTIKESYGNVGSGMQTFATAPGMPKYAAGIRFRPVKAKYIRLKASGGDGMYSAAELQVFGMDGEGH
jgi:hypothetical protein